MRIFQERNLSIIRNFLVVEISCLNSNNSTVEESHLHWTIFGHGIIVQDVDEQSRIRSTEHSELA